MDNDKLNELYAQQRSIDAQIRARKIEIAKEMGQVVGSIDDLTCKKHQNAIFRVDKTIPGSWTYPKERDKKGLNKLNKYVCGSCMENGIIFHRSKAYDCPTCGIVIGDFVIRDYKSPEESWYNLAGREGEHYYCKVCDTQLGELYWKFS